MAAEDDAVLLDDPDLGKADTIDQDSPDVTVLKAEAIDEVRPTHFDASKCTDPGSFDMDCTAEIEGRIGAPALHEVRAPAGEVFSSFFCRLLEVTTVSKNGAVAGADGIGFYYRGNGIEGFRFVPRSKLKKIGEVTLKNGEAATLHQFIGLANCWQGTISSSFAARYRFKPFMQFTAGDTGHVYRNWDEADDYVISASHDRFDRSAELLR
jgi:hypothetical protein